MSQQQAAYEFTTPGGQEFFLEDQNNNDDADESRLAVVSSGVVRGVDGSSIQNDSNYLSNAEITAMFVVAAAAMMLVFLYCKNKRAQQQQEAKRLANADGNSDDDDDDVTHVTDDGVTENEITVEIPDESSGATGSGSNNADGMEVVWRRSNQSETA